MTKRCIGIDITQSHLHAVQIAQSGKNIQMEKSFSAPLPNNQEHSCQLLKSLAGEHGFDRRSAVAMAIPHQQLFFANINNQTTSSASPTAAREHFPIPSADIITLASSRHSLSKKIESALVTATSRKSLESQLNLSKKAQLKCEQVDAPVFALLAAIKFNHPEISKESAILIYTDSQQTILAATKNNDIRIARNLPSPEALNTEEKSAHLLIREIEITWRVAFGGKIPENSNVVLAGTITQSEHLQSAIQQELSCLVTNADLSLQIKTPNQDAIPPELTLASGLALRNLAPNETTGINLAKASTKKTPKSNVLTRQQVITACILLAAFFLAYTAATLVRKARMEYKNTQLKNRTQQLFAITLPNEPIVDELSQIETHLNAVRSEYASLQPYITNTEGPLDILKVITAHTPANLGINIMDINITDTTVKLTASCSSHGTPAAWGKILNELPIFESVDMKDPKRTTATGTITFTMNIKLKRDKL